MQEKEKKENSAADLRACPCNYTGAAYLKKAEKTSTGKRKNTYFKVLSYKVHFLDPCSFVLCLRFPEEPFYQAEESYPFSSHIFIDVDFIEINTLKEMKEIKEEDFNLALNKFMTNLAKIGEIKK